MDKLIRIFFFLNYKNQGNIPFESIHLLRLPKKRNSVTVGHAPEFLRISQSIATKNIKNKIKGFKVDQREIIHFQNINQCLRVVGYVGID